MSVRVFRAARGKSTHVRRKHDGAAETCRDVGPPPPEGVPLRAYSSHPAALVGVLGNAARVYLHLTIFGVETTGQSQAGTSLFPRATFIAGIFRRQMDAAHGAGLTSF